MPGKVLLSEGDFNILANIDASVARMALAGAGWGTRLVAQAAIDMVTLTANEITVEDIAFDANGVANRGVVAHVVDHANIRHNYGRGFSRAGFKANGSLDGTPSRYVRFINNTLVDCTASIALDGEAEDVVVALNTILGSAGDGGIATDRLSALPYGVKGIVITGNRINLSDHTRGAIYIGGGIEFAITGNSITFATAGAVQGIRLASTVLGSIVGNQIKGPDSGNEYGIYLLAVNHTTVADNPISLCGTGIYLDNNTSNLTIRDNNLKLCTVGIVPGTGLNHIIRDNDGYVTENSGTATLVNGQVAIVVNHGLDVTPAAGDIMVTPMESLGAASMFWIDTYTATQFTIHVDVNPTQDVDFAWKAVVL